MSGRHWARRRAPKHAPDPEASSKSAFILFDVDGTLLDGAHAIAGTMVDAFLAAGEPPPQLREVRELIGLSLPEMVDVLTAGRPRDLGDKIRAGYLVRYFDAIERQFEPPVFPGAETAILRLRRAGIPLGLVTGKAARSVRQMLDAMDWHQHFRTVQCADRNPSKPDPTMVAKALLEGDRKVSETILVGDSRYDMRMARKAGIRAVGVSWGYNPPEELLAEGATAVARDFGHLTELLLAMVDAEAQVALVP